MLCEYAEKISNAQTLAAYEQILEEFTDYLLRQGKIQEVQELLKISVPQKNRFSSREMAEELSRKKNAVIGYCKVLQTNTDNKNTDTIESVLKNFPLFCKNLYKSQVHNKCSNGIKEHLTGFRIENEYDLQKLIIAALSLYFPDARTESVQDSGHHAVRRDIVIDSEFAVIELKCTHTGMTERQLSEEIAADLVHYECRKLYFYIYDKSKIINNAVSFQQAYEKRNVDNKVIHMIIYDHDDI